MIRLSTVECEKGIQSQGDLGNAVVLYLCSCEVTAWRAKWRLLVIQLD